MNLLHCAKSRTSQEINRFRHVWKQHFHINLRQIKLRKCTQAANPERDCLCKHISPLHANDLAPPNPVSFPLPPPQRFTPTGSTPTSQPSSEDVSTAPNPNRTKSVSSTRRQLAQSPSCAYPDNIERCPRRQRATRMRVAITKRLSSR